MKRPFYSIIISCYNAKPYINTILQSIVTQQMDNDIEVIISDDCSTEPYFDEVEKYMDSLNIKIVKTDYNKCPGNTRQRGVENATGEWLLFADQDDAFVPGSLMKIKTLIKETGEQYYITTPIIISNLATDEIIKIKKGDCGLTHGKFINNDNLWKAGNLSYKKDMMTHEDIYISSNIICFLHSINKTLLLDIDQPTYIWYAHPESLGQTITEDGIDFLENNFIDMIHATASVYLNFYNKNKIDKKYTIQQTIISICFMYYYINSFIFRNPNNWVKKNLNIYCKKIINEIKNTLGINNSFIYEFICKDNGLLFDDIRERTLDSAGMAVPNFSIIDFLEYCSPDNTIRKVI